MTNPIRHSTATRTRLSSVTTTGVTAALRVAAGAASADVQRFGGSFPTMLGEPMHVQPGRVKKVAGKPA